MRLHNSIQNKECFLRQCAEEQKLYKTQWPWATPSHMDNRQSLKPIVDEYSKSILPPPFKDLYDPVECTGDGNCLYR